MEVKNQQINTKHQPYKWAEHRTKSSLQLGTDTVAVRGLPAMGPLVRFANPGRLLRQPCYYSLRFRGVNGQNLEKDGCDVEFVGNGSLCGI